jgi:hypothetical protein
MHDPECELRRIHLPRTSVHKGKEKGRSSYAPAPRLTAYTTRGVGRSVGFIPCSCLVAYR